MRLIKSGLLALVLVVLALGARAAPGAEGHASLVRSQPEDGASLAQGPAEIALWFTEAVEIGYSKAHVQDAAGTRWEQPIEGSAFHIHTDATNPGLYMRPNMPNGQYTVVWDVLSAVDGHRTKGYFSFYVGPPPLEPLAPVEPPGGGSSVPPEWLEVFSRWANFAAMAALTGAALFPFLVLPAGVARLQQSAGNDQAVRRAVRICRISTVVAAVALVAASVLAVWVQAWLATGESSSLSAVKDFVSDSRYGDIWIARMALAAGAVVCTGLIMARSGGEWHESITHPKNTPWAILAALAIALPVTTSLNSHAAGGGDFDLSTAVDYVHLVAGGVWLGMLVQFMLAAVLVVPRLDERAGFLGGSVQRFSWIALPTVAVIVITGIIQSIDRLGGIDELFDSDYGLTLAVKILLLAPLLVIAAFNLLVFGPRFLSFARQRAQAMLSSMRSWEGAFRAGLVAEVGIAAVVLIISAMLTNTSPPGSAQVDGTEESANAAQPTPAPDSGFAQVEDLDLSVWAEPGTPGVNDVNVLVIDGDGDEKAIQRVYMRFKKLDEDVGVSQAEAEAIHPPTHFVATTSDLSLPGNWEVEVTVRREGLRDAVGTVELEIAAPATPTPAP